MKPEMKKIIEAADFIGSKIPVVPKFCIILGSGLGAFADHLAEKIFIPFEEIPHFPRSTVEGHKGQIVVGNLSGIPVLVFQGRFHYYEGYSMNQIAFPLRCMLHLGVPNLIVTNAAGSVDPRFRPGNLMLIKDHIMFHGENPLRGPNFEAFGPRFNDMSDPYPKKTRELAKSCANHLEIELKEGVYYYMTGPSYETASEVRAINILGANAVGMSTAPEVIVASHGGMDILGISCITNMGTGIVDQAVGHDEVIATGRRVEDTFVRLLREVVGRWSRI